MNESLTIEFTADCTPMEAYAAILDVRGWWSGQIDGPTDELGGEFTYRYEDMHRSRQRITALEPGRRVAWHVVDAWLKFVADKDEWTGTDITFDIEPAGSATRVVFRHVGLAEEVECFEQCSSAWRFYIGSSLPELISGGVGRPNAREDE
jgi:hypothetical protein